MPRSIWNGALSFAGIDVPVKVFGADPQGVQFRELHEPDGAEIAHQLVDADGRRVDRKQVVKGFEVPLPRHYRDRVLDLVARKAKGEEIDTERAQAPEPSDDLMAALEASLDKVRAG